MRCPRSYQAATNAMAFGHQRLEVVGITVVCPECGAEVHLVKNHDHWIYKSHNQPPARSLPGTRPGANR